MKNAQFMDSSFFRSQLMLFFLWGYTKDVYAGNSTTFQDLKTAITRLIRAIQGDMCKRVTENFAVRWNEFLNHILSTSYDCQDSYKLR